MKLFYNVFYHHPQRPSPFIIRQSPPQNLGFSPPLIQGVFSLLVICKFLSSYHKCPLSVNFFMKTNTCAREPENTHVPVPQPVKIFLSEKALPAWVLWQTFACCFIRWQPIRMFQHNATLSTFPPPCLEVPATDEASPKLIFQFPIVTDDDTQIDRTHGPFPKPVFVSCRGTGWWS